MESTSSQVYKILSKSNDSTEKSRRMLDWLMGQVFSIDAYKSSEGRSRKFVGAKVAHGGTGVHAASSAMAAIALWEYGSQSDVGSSGIQYKSTAMSILESLLEAQEHAMNTDGHGIVASVLPSGSVAWPLDEASGESIRFLPVLHTAATAWTGLALDFIKGNEKYANPLAPYHEKEMAASSTRAIDSSSALQSEVIRLVMTSAPMSIVSIVFSFISMISMLVLGGIVVMFMIKSKVNPYEEALGTKEKNKKFYPLTPLTIPTRLRVPTSTNTPRSPAIERSPFSPCQLTPNIPNYH